MPWPVPPNFCDNQRRPSILSIGNGHRNGVHKMASSREQEVSSLSAPASVNGHHGFDFGNIASSAERTATATTTQTTTPAADTVAPERGFTSPTSQLPDTTGRTSSSNGTAARGVADFFSSEVFQIVLHNPSTAHQLLKFSRARMCGENMEFLERVRTAESR